MVDKTLFMKFTVKKSRIALGKTIRKIRQSKKLTQIDCAEAMGCTQSQWSLYETGKSSPPFDVIIELLIVLDISLFILLGEFGKMYKTL